MSTAEKAVVQGLFDAINDRRLGDLRRCMTDDVIDHNKVIHGEPDEPGAAFDAIAQQLDAFDPFHLKVEEMIGEGDRVAVRLTMSGVNSGSHPGCRSPPTVRSPSRRSSSSPCGRGRSRRCAR